MGLVRFSVVGKAAAVAAAALFTLLCLVLLPGTSANLIFQVQSKFKGRERSLSALRAHDTLRHGRLLAANLDIQLGGSGNPSETGLYYAKISIGTPPKDHYVQVDTGSDILWVNCADCDSCPTKSDDGLPLTRYDPNGSSTGSLVTCDQEFCRIAYDGAVLGCKPQMKCEYSVEYGDGSTTAGYFVSDKVQLDQVSGNLQSTPTNASIVFGCAAKQSGDIASTREALGGILGFGQANSSVLSQLASMGKVKKMFAHCLDSVNGGGIFTIGEVVQPKVKTSKLVSEQSHYTLLMKAIEVGGENIQLATNFLEIALGEGSGEGKGAIIDSGTTLAYLPRTIFDQVMAKILAHRPGLQLRTVEDHFSCFDYSEVVDDGFPVVKFLFYDSLSLPVYPHEYLFQIRQTEWCFGWQRSTVQSANGDDIALLGDLVLSNRLVVYDVENESIGWVEYNCSSSIVVKDADSGAHYTVGAHDLSSDISLVCSKIFVILFVIITMLQNFVL